eukprot:62020-Hanusia_phi.AAC.1
MMFTMSWWMIVMMLMVERLMVEWMEESFGSDDDGDDDCNTGFVESHKLVEEVETSLAQVGKGMGCELLLPTARS